MVNLPVGIFLKVQFKSFVLFIQKYLLDMYTFNNISILVCVFFMYFIFSNFWLFYTLYLLILELTFNFIIFPCKNGSRFSYILYKKKNSLAKSSLGRNCARERERKSQEPSFSDFSFTLWESKDKKNKPLSWLQKKKNTPAYGLWNILRGSVYFRIVITSSHNTFYL